MFFECLQNCNFTVVSVIADKNKIRRQINLYPEMLKSLMGFIGKNNTANIHIDGRQDRKSAEIKTFLRHNNFQFTMHMRNSKNDVLIQMADMFAGAVSKNETEFLKLFGDKIKIEKYG